MLVEKNVSLQPYNSFGIVARAETLVRVRSLQDLVDWHHTAVRAGEAVFVLGGGSNVVLTGDVKTTVLKMELRGRRLVQETPDAWVVEVAAGEPWHGTVAWTLQQGWPGLENLALIPGTTGAAPVQNIGAYGLEVGDCLHSVTAWDFAKQAVVSFDRDDCRFAYRDSRFKQEGWHLNGGIAITSVVFRLAKAWQPNCRYADVAQELAARHIAAPTARDIATAVIAVRQRKLPDPAVTPNAGSFFHNPVVSALQADALKAAHPTLPCYPQPDGRVKLAAGWLIEQAGWKGKTLGPVGMYEKQALVLVNQGGATGDDVKRTMAAVQADVLQRFGVVLTPEPIFL